jgi:anti-sigma regulatory factor (Ser/Thr protein kinase)
MFNSFIGYSEYDHETIKRFQGFDLETGKNFWNKSLAAYLETTCPTKIREVENKARIIGYTRMIRRSIRRKGLETEDGRAEIKLWTKELLELLEDTDTLTFSRDELDIEALRENLPEVQTFVDERLDAVSCPPKDKVRIGVAVEEIFVNIANYAYSPEKGRAIVRVEAPGNPVTVTITFIDHGVPYDPLAKEDPDVTLRADERQVGGLGIFMAKQIMDELAYEYKDGQNILILKKTL